MGGFGVRFVGAGSARPYQLYSVFFRSLRKTDAFCA